MVCCVHSPAANNFERGAIDKFMIKCKDLGDLTHIVVRAMRPYHEITAQGRPWGLVPYHPSPHVPLTPTSTRTTSRPAHTPHGLRFSVPRVF